MQKGLNNNQMKLLALITMTVDHIGAVLFPEAMWLRLIGRLSFPIYAYMIAEDCRHTKSMPRYLASLGVLAAVCQLVYLVAMGSLHQGIMVTFTLSAGLIFLIRKGQETKNAVWWILAGLGTAGVFFLAEILPMLLPNTDYGIDYGFWGIVLPVAVYVCPKKWMKLAVMIPVLSLIAFGSWEGQWAGLLAVPVLALYNGQRGKWNMKWFFYLYYPAHLVAIQGVAYLLSCV